MTDHEPDFTLHLTVPVSVLDAVTMPIALAEAQQLTAISDLLATVDEHLGRLEIRLTGTEDGRISESLRDFARLCQQVRQTQGSQAGVDVLPQDGVLVLTVHALTETEQLLRRRRRAQRARFQHQSDTDLQIDLRELLETRDGLPEHEGIQRAKVHRHICQIRTELSRRGIDS